MSSDSFDFDVPCPGDLGHHLTNTINFAAWPLSLRKGFAFPDIPQALRLCRSGGAWKMHTTDGKPEAFRKESGQAAPKTGPAAHYD